MARVRILKHGTSGIFEKQFGYVNFSRFYTPSNMEAKCILGIYCFSFTEMVKMANNECVVYGGGAVAERTVRK